MAGRAISTLVVVLALAVASFWPAADAQSNGCTSVLATLAPCLNYITGNSTTPSASCCSQLSSVVRSNPQCLCLVLNGTLASSLGTTINQTRALALPGACNVQTPPISSCNASSTAGPPVGTPSSPGVNTIAPSPTSSDGNSATLSISLLILLLFIASSTSGFNLVHASYVHLTHI